MDIRRHLEPEKRHCDMCDFFGFERRTDGSWAFCFFKGRHFPDDIEPGRHSCLNMSFRGEDVFNVQEAVEHYRKSGGNYDL